MKVIIAEKPSVAQGIASVVGARQRKEGYLTGDGYAVTWAFGHLVGLAMPESYGFSGFRREHLPILPQEFRLVPRQVREGKVYKDDPGVVRQLEVLRELFDRCESIIVATDAGREGELIFRYVYNYLGCTKPFVRLWISSLTDKAIREGLRNLREGSLYDNLYLSAKARSEADWLVGINSSQALSLAAGQGVFSLGRVQTPTLAMICSRYRENKQFVPRKYFQIKVSAAKDGIAFSALSRNRFDDLETATAGLREVEDGGMLAVSSVERREAVQEPPLLYDLTALQKEANGKLDFSADKTLTLAQSLYEKKVLSYPRTGSRYISEDVFEEIPSRITLLQQYPRFAAIASALRDTPLNRRPVDDAKVTDHHALLPTKSMANADLAALPAGERNILRLISARLLCAVGEPHRYAETTLTTICAEEEFSAKGKVVLSDGWKAMERKMLGELLGKQKEVAALPDVQEQSQCSVAGAELKEGQTSPPKHFSEDTLLSAMQAAGADSMPEGVERQGIGTPATRAATIEKLVQKGFLERKGSKKTKVLLPTDKGKALITVMPEEIQSPEMTADWETKLLQIERGEMEPGEFMTEINTMITELVKNTEMKKGVNALMKNKIIGVCPNCGANVVEREKGWFCESNPCRFVLWKDNAFFKRLGKRLDAHVADKLLRDGRVRLKDCKSAKGKTYNATVLLSCEADGRSKFSLEFEGGC